MYSLGMSIHALTQTVCLAVPPTRKGTGKWEIFPLVILVRNSFRIYAIFQLNQII